MIDARQPGFSNPELHTSRGWAAELGYEVTMEPRAPANR
jgi:hypothetical protein